LSSQVAVGRWQLAEVQRHWWRWALGLAVLLVVATAPAWLLLDSEQRTLASVFMFVVLAQGWNLIGGFAGYPSFGNVVFFGLGGYTTAVLMVKAGAGFWVTLPAAALVGVGFAALMGIPILRLKGHYFAVATLGVAEGMREVVINTGGLTGGNRGLTIPAVGADATTSYPGNTGFYYLFLVLALGAMALVWGVARSRFGYSLRAISQDEEAAAAAGINTTKLMVVMCVFGGAGTVIGPMVGAVILQYLSEWLRDNLTDYHTFVFGAIIVLAVLLMPMGLVNFTRDAWKQRRIALFEATRKYRL
jgi:branched-chain amino acid transport system permease protein